MDRIQASTHYIRVLADQADRLGYDSAKKLVEAGIPPAVRDQKHPTIDNDLLAGFIRILWETTGDEAAGFQPTPVRPGTFGFIFENFMAAETLGEMLRKAHRCLRYVDYQNNALRLREARGQAILEVDVDTGERDPEHFWREFWAIIWHRVPCWAIGEKIPLIKAEFSYPAPAHWQLYEQQFQCRVAFGCPATTLVFNDRYLRRRICRDRQDVLAWLRHSPADLLYTPTEDHTLSSQIRGW
jgi:hypothetical protein